MSDHPRPFADTESSFPTLRLSEDANEQLKRGARSKLPPPPGGIPETLPNPVFPRNPKLFHAQDADYLPKEGKRHYTIPQIYHHMRGWMFPYFRSRLLPGEFHPLITYLFTESKCNLDCHYCWAYDNRVAGMTEDVAKRSIDWLHSTSGRVLALM